jgi:hypothetical protein
MHYTYTKINKYCNLSGTGRTDNQKFLTSDISKLYEYPQYPPLFEYPKLDKGGSDSSKCSLNEKGVCKDWKNDPSLWGPHLWAYMHYSAANYPEKPSKENIDEMVDWLCSLPVTIPCANCSTHYRKYIEQNKSNLKNICGNKTSLFNFLVDIHNKVNVRNGKSEMSYDDAWKLYKK